MPSLPSLRIAAPFLFVVALGVAGCPPPDEVCDNGHDDDEDGNIDCDDADCAAECEGREGEGGEGEEGEGAEGEGGEGEGGEGEGGEGEGGEGEGGEGEGGEGEGAGVEIPGDENCIDGDDNDGDFLINRADPGCRDDSLDTETDVDDQCQNGLDDDYDGLPDDSDPDCAASGVETDPTKLPDLIVLGDRAGPVDFEVRNVTDGDPELLERCYRATGSRRIMLFDTFIANIGTGVLNITSNEAHPGVWVPTPLGGNQFEGWSRLTVTDSEGIIVAAGHKPSFCMTDFTPPLVDGAPQTLAGCGGLDINYYDEYNRALPCQFVDITDVEAGDYTLSIETNVFHEIPELDYTNNVADIDVSIPPP